jgi:hypothetical protein
MNSREKDKAWRRYKELKESIRDHQITKSEMWKPTEYNVKKCMKEITHNAKPGEELKKIAKLLGEESNLEKFRR